MFVWHNKGLTGLDGLKEGSCSCRIHFDSMAIKATHNKIQFSVGDLIKVSQIVDESGKKRTQAFEGRVISIKGDKEGKTFTIRRIGANQVGIEKIFPFNSPLVESVEVLKAAGRGVRRAKLYYIRDKSRKEIEKIPSRAKKKELQDSHTKKSKVTKKTKSEKKGISKKQTSKSKGSKKLTKKS